jgi:hypothetical protein
LYVTTDPTVPVNVKLALVPEHIAVVEFILAVGAPGMALITTLDVATDTHPFASVTVKL